MNLANKTELVRVVRHKHEGSVRNGVSVHSPGILFPTKVDL